MVDVLLTYLKEHASVLLVVILLLASFVLLIHWLAWIFSWGRFKSNQSSKVGGLRFVFADLLVKIINDFRHLLALMVVLIFAFTLLFVMWETRGLPDKMLESIQVVVAALGGLIGSIIGYYFGESAGKKPTENIISDSDSVAELEQDVEGEDQNDLQEIENADVFNPPASEKNDETENK